MIDFKNVTFIYPGKVVGLNNISFHIESGTFTAILGPSGAGKSTILWSILGELIPAEGEISCLGFNPADLTKHEMMKYRRRIGLVPQEFMLFEKKTVFENIYLILRGIGLPHKDAEVKTLNVLDIVGLRDRKNAKPPELSGGERQRIAIARALGMNPQIILADEPTGNLDPAKSEEIMDLFQQINKMGITVLVVTHEWELMQKLGADLLYIEDKRVKPFTKEKEKNA